MKGQTPQYAFNGVDVGLPSKVRGSEAEEEWQEIDWVSWSTGELTVDGDSFLLVFKPSGGSVKAKPLGSLIRASAVEGQRESRTLIVTTSDTLHRMYRLTFQSAQHAQEFCRLAESAEKTYDASSAMGKDSASARTVESAAESKLEADIREKLAGRWPLVFSGAELYGHSAGGEAGSEVLLGRGAFVLLDPAEGTRTVGSYELLFYGMDEGAREPVKRFAIGPAMALARQKQPAADDDGPAVIFELTDPTSAHQLAFDSIAAACGFARDFRVRQHLMAVARKTAKKGNESDDLRTQIETMKQQSVSARVVRLVKFLCFFILVGLLIRVALLFAEDKVAKGAAAYAEKISEEVFTAGRMLRSAATNGGATVCELFVGSVPMADVQRCAALAAERSEDLQVRRCLKALVN